MNYNMSEAPDHDILILAKDLGEREYMIVGKRSRLDKRYKRNRFVSSFELQYGGNAFKFLNAVAWCELPE